MANPSARYFNEFSEALDLSEASAVAVKPPDPGLDRLPFDLIDDRRFEVMVYRLKCAEVGGKGRVTLMQGVGERGRDVVVYGQRGAVCQIIQCKRLQERMTAPAVRQELLKLALHGFREPEILGEGPITYELWCPGGLTEPAAAIVDRWPVLWTEAGLRADAEEIISENSRLKTLTWDTVKNFVIKQFPAILRPIKLDNIDITPRVRSCTPVHSGFFQGNFRMDPADVDEAIRKALSEIGGYRELSDKDAKHVLERVSSFPPDQRLVHSSGYVLGVPPQLVARFNRDEYKEFVTHAVNATIGILRAVMSAASRLAFDAAREFRECVRPSNTSITHVFSKTLTISVLAHVTSMTYKSLKLQPRLEAYASLDLRSRLEYHAKEVWDEYQRCLTGYDPKRHSPGSEEEYRSQIAKSALGGAATREQFEQALLDAIESNYAELEQRFQAHMALLPKSVLVITDTITAFEDARLLGRMVESDHLLARIRGSAIVPE